MRRLAVALYVIVGITILGFAFNYLHAGDHSWRPVFALLIGAYFLFRAYTVGRAARI